MLVLGADASNAFAEAPAPKAPLYVIVDQQFREWWRQQVQEDIPEGWVLPVKHALQGHLDSPRLIKLSKTKLACPHVHMNLAYMLAMLTEKRSYFYGK